MGTGVVLALLHVGGAALSDGAPRDVQLLNDAPSAPYAQMTRAQQRKEYRALEARRPGLALPVIGASVGFAGAGITGAVFWMMFSTPYGLAVYSAVLLIATFALSLGVVAGSVALYIRNNPQRDAIGLQLEELEDAGRRGRCRNVRGDFPCENDPSGPPPPPPAPFVPQVLAPARVPSVVIARF